jgi:hypothetical protein
LPVIAKPGIKENVMLTVDRIGTAQKNKLGMKYTLRDTGALADTMIRLYRKTDEGV